MSNLPMTDKYYKDWIANISKRFHQGQIKAALKVNEEMLRLYWSLGHDMDEIKRSYNWGARFYDQISKDLQKALPDLKSFSPRNLLYMHQYYRLFPMSEQAASRKSESSIAPQVGAQNELPEITPQVGAQIFLIPWGHIKLLIDKCQSDQNKALFYVHKTLENNWSRAVLLNILDTDLYERQGKAVTNFHLTLPAVQSDLAQAMTRDPYQFDFLTIREKYDEKELKDALIRKVESFLLELGTGFAFMGREVRLLVGEKEKYIDYAIL